MSINSLVTSALANIGVPVVFLEYTGNASTYVTFFIFGENGEAWAEDSETDTAYSVQVDLWSKSNSLALAGQIVSAMQTAGFIKTTSADLYEKDTKIYHKAIRFYYLQNN